MFRFCTALLLSVMLAATAFAASPAADQIFPDSTKGFFSLRNLNDFGEQWKKTQFGQLMDDPLMENFKKEVQKQLTDRMEKTFGLALDGISSLPSGEVAFGLIAIPYQVPGYVLTMDVAGKRNETDKYLANFTQKLLANGVKKSTTNYKGQQITILTFPPPAPVERKAHYMFFQDVLIASDQIHLLQLIADRIAGQPGRALASVEGYQAVMGRCISDMPAGMLPAMRWYIEPLDYGESIRVLLRGPVVQNRREKPSIFSVLKQQGLDAIQGIGGVVSVKTEEHESVYRTFLYTKKPYRLAMQVFSFPDSTDFVPPSWMPADLARCTMLYVDPITIFDNFGGVFDAVIDDTGGWKNIVEGLEKDIYGPRIHLRNELITHLGNRAFGMSRYEKPISAQSESIVIAVELKPDREAAMRACVEKLFKNDPLMSATMYKTYKIWHYKPMEVSGRQTSVDKIPASTGEPAPLVDAVVQVAAQRLNMEEDEDRPPAFPNGGIVVTKEYFLVSSNKDYLKVILERIDSPAESANSTIANEAEYKSVTNVFEKLGLKNKPHFYQFFARTPETVRPTYEMMRNNQIVQSQASLAKLLNVILASDKADSRNQIVDGSTMPEFDKIQHYLGSIGIYGTSEANGYFIKGFTLER